ncbi:DUF4360 domain-containing protein [Leucothrix pacifica]|uniref:DUF4360 domain-containing protein n=1 Tax=Leucothrix pacifica TaxID=1247513 RepID=A0A317C593_9GAMM|nr:DUF4360 domain-containing protein [Leucothrix pacifica]PWQ92533.1 hypothetical protein DKW60_20630 [Leucothrix pacifica]
MNSLQKIGIIAVTTIFNMAMATSASVADVTFGSPGTFKGTGCSGESTVEVVGENTANLIVLFGQYDAGNGKPSASGLSRSACSFAIPINVLPGFQVSAVTVDWETYTEGQGQLKRKLFSLGIPRYNWLITNLSSGKRTVRDSFMHALFSTDCNGGRYIMRINSQVRANPGSYIAVGSTDLNNKIVFKIKFKKCQ